MSRKGVQITISMPKDIAEFIKKAAKERGATFSGLLVRSTVFRKEDGTLELRDPWRKCDT